METKYKKYGWKPQLPDHRDHQYSVTAPIKLPVKTNNIIHCPPVYDQGQLGSCTGNGIAGSIEYEQIKKGDKTPFIPSRLFIYYNERVMEGTVNQDAGANIRDGIKSVAQQGVCKETTWPYVISKFKTKPPVKAVSEAVKYKAVTYSAVNVDMTSIKTALANGDIIVFGFTVYTSFESDAVAKTGIVPMPAKTESVLGGHCVCAIDYDDTKQWVVCRNSWGPAWGDKGYFYMPYSYFTTNLTSDYWVIKDVMI